MIMSGAVDFKSDEPENRQFIGYGFFFAWSLFNGMNLATIQKFYVQENGENTPMKIGLSFGAKLFSSLKEFLMTGVLFREASKLWEDEKDESYEDGYEEAAAAVRAELLAVMKTKFGKDVKSGEIPTDKEWEEVNNMLKAKQIVQSFMLRYANPTSKQLLEVNADEFLQREGALLRKLTV